MLAESILNNIAPPLYLMYMSIRFMNPGPDSKELQ